jgi:chemotaxis protein histidine kinase CheA
LRQSLKLIRSYIEEINQLISKISHIYQYFRPKRTYEVEVLLRVVKNLIKNLEDSTKKKVELIYNNFDGVSIPYKCRLELKDILVQLTRNSFFHGIELAAERQKAKKEKLAQIVIETFNEEGSIGFNFRDDGRGLQVENIRKAALNTGKWKKSEIDSLDEEKIKDLIFVPGVTTASTANTTAGRGIGMDVIKQMVDKLGGSIRVNTETGIFTEFTICFPTNP